MSDRTMTIPETAGWCAWDCDECTVTIAVDTVEQMNVLLRQLKPRNRILVVDDEGQSA